MILNISVLESVHKCHCTIFSRHQNTGFSKQKYFSGEVVVGACIGLVFLGSNGRMCDEGGVKIFESSVFMVEAVAVVKGLGFPVVQIWQSISVQKAQI